MASAYYGTTTNGLSKTNSHNVLCVSGKELVSSTVSNFNISSDGKVITDSRTGLMWQKGYSIGKWRSALAYCQTLNTESYGGYSDWRLPNKNELASLLDPSKSEAPYSNFPDMRNCYWSSSTSIGGGSDSAWVVYFYYGMVSRISKTSLNDIRVMCVRN